jgi:Zn-dependent membrane protease YugP
MEALLSAIVTWLSINYGLPPNYSHPTIELLPNAQIENIHYGALDLSWQRKVVAVYDAATKTVILSDAWTGISPADQSVLVHEMVHHLQSLADLRYECPASREKLAYAAQEEWLGLFGGSLLTEFKLDRMTLKLTTQCMPY